ncbi:MULTISPECIES: ATP-binding protein [unclassified Crossiella]|uniref:ATP-binding protein n=1 Tax=unclassified Crossiella TaxID=2620835 RepID=UPI001FFFC2B6|nr:MULTISPECIES: ATP-binding protein [unclassified Crossiella]MCK2237534.1 ATP-binding protein [Crossiella sp. S99.2]MCK2254820.1 ATP-binding protein [Crossiella sp. S99.1]
MAEYLARLCDQLIAELVAEFPALLVLGPRGVGKTTSAAEHAKTIIRLDQPAEATALAADPDVVLRGLPEPVLLDEWQLVPSVLSAVKRAVDTERRPGRFIITGSVHADLEQPTWPGTGRLLRVDMSGLTVGELIGADLSRPPFIDRVLAEGRAGLRAPAYRADLRAYLKLALQGGFPEAALHLSERGRRRWAHSYLDQLFTRDLAQVDVLRDPDRLHRYFEAYALNTAGLATEQTLLDTAGVNRKTGEAYERLLTNLFVVAAVPAWHSNRLKRLVRGPKRYVLDPGLLAAALGLDEEGLLRDGDLLGRFLDTFVFAQLRAELPLSEHAPRIYHLRDQGGRHEVDLVIELGGHRVIGIEIKASAAPGQDSAKHLEWLRDQLGDKFVHGIVLHTGPRVFPMGDRITAAPISSIWT